MRAGELVNEEIAADARTVIAVVAPPEESLRVPRDLRRMAHKAIPVAGLRRGVGRDRILPRAHRPAPPQTGIDQIQLADGAGGQYLFGFFVNDGACELAADLEDSLRLVLRFDDGEPFFELLHHRLFAVDVLVG